MPRPPCIAAVVVAAVAAALPFIPQQAIASGMAVAIAGAHLCGQPNTLELTINTLEICS